MRIVAISDTHNRHHQIAIPECDILIHAGDATGRGHEFEVRDFARWFNEQPATHKVFIPGNHEKIFEKRLPESMAWFTEECPTGHVLINQLLTIDGLKIYGSPVTPWFYDWAWNEYTDGLKRTWEAVPADIDIMVSHGPAHGILDEIEPGHGHLGCAVLRDELARIKPQAHIFGHIHGGHGQLDIDGIK